MPILDPEDKDLFLRTLNKKGFLLEDKVWKTLFDRGGSIERNKVIDSNGRVEIDLVYKIGNKILIVECKHTDFSWIFPKAIERSNPLNLFYKRRESWKDGEFFDIKTRETLDFKTAWFDIAIMFNDENRLILERNNNLAKTSYKDVNEHVNQVLKEMKTYIFNESIKTAEIIIPVIITNAPLHFLVYTKGDINSFGDLTNFNELEEIPCIIYNYPEIFGLEPERKLIKSVFIININYLNEVLDLILDQDLVHI